MSVMHNRYVTVVACAFGLGLSFSALFFYTMPALMKPMAEANGWTRTQVSAGVSVATLFMAIGSFLAGGLLDRFGVRRVVVVSSVFFAGMLYVLSRVPSSLPMYYALAALLGLSSLGASPLSYMALLAKWFDARLGTAMGVAMLGMGCGYALAPLVATHLVQTLGWRGAYAGLSAIALLPVVNALLFVREPHAGSRIEATLRNRQVSEEGITLREALQTRTFWLLMGSGVLISTAINGSAVHLISLITDRGIALSDAAGAGAVLGVTIMLVRFATGVLLDRLPIPVISAVAFIGGGFGLLLLSSGLGGAVPFVAAAFMGLASGAEADILGYATRRYFGTRAFGRIAGVVTGLYALGAVVGPLLLGRAFDRLGSYTGMMLFFAGMCFVAAIASLAMGQPRYKQQRETHDVPADSRYASMIDTPR